MAEVSIVVNDVKTGKTYVKKGEHEAFLHKKIGETVDGVDFGLNGYQFQITGGSDKAGFPMRFDVEGSGRKRPLVTSGPGVTISRKGMKMRKTVAGNTIGDSVAQVNLKTTSYGKETLAKLFGKEEAPVEATKTEAATPSEEKATQEDKN